MLTKNPIQNESLPPPVDHIIKTLIMTYSTPGNNYFPNKKNKENILGFEITN